MGSISTHSIFWHSVCTRSTFKMKPITPEDKLQEALDELARDIALIEPDPKDWAGWVIYLLEQMEMEENTGCKQCQA